MSAAVLLAAVAQRLALAGHQALAAFDQAQKGLDLGAVLDAPRVCSPEGIAASRETLDALRTLMRRHREVFAAFLTDGTRQLLEAGSGLPPDEQARFTRGLQAAVERQLAEQAAFWAGRERWIAAASRALDLAALHDGELRLDDGTLVIDDPEVLEDLCACVDEMDTVREQEVALMQARLGRITAGMAHLADPAGD